MDALTLESWVRRAREGKATPRELSAVFAEATLIFPVAHRDPASGDSAPVVIEDPDGRAYVVVFTEPGRMCAFGQTMPYLESTGADLAQHWPPGLSCLINPGSAGLELAIDSVAVRSWARGEATTLPRGTALVVGPPPQPPSRAMLAAVATALADVDGVAEIYLFGLERHGVPRLTGGVVLTASADEAEVLPAVMSRVNDALPAEQQLPWVHLPLELRALVRGFVEPVQRAPHLSS